MNVLIITTEWPEPDHPNRVPFIVQQVESLRRAGVNVEVFHLRGRSNPINYVKAWFDIRRQPAWRNAELLHAQWGQSGLMALFSKRKLVVTFRGSDLYGLVNSIGHHTLSGKLLVFASKLVSMQANYCITVSRELQRRLPRGTKSTVIPNGINLALFRPIDRIQCRINLGLDVNKKYILFAGDNRNPIKRYFLAKEAVELVQKEYDVELLVVTGIEHYQIPIYMNAVDGLILSSTHEGSPNVVKEALACNLPIVSVDVGDVRELTQSIEGCMICEPSAVALANGVKQVLASGKRINAAEVVNSLDEAKIVQRIINIYQHVLTNEK